MWWLSGNANARAAFKSGARPKASSCNHEGLTKVTPIPHPPSRSLPKLRPSDHFRLKPQKNTKTFFSTCSLERHNSNFSTRLLVTTSRSGLSQDGNTARVSKVPIKAVMFCIRNQRCVQQAIMLEGAKGQLLRGSVGG